MSGRWTMIRGREGYGPRRRFCLGFRMLKIRLITAFILIAAFLPALYWLPQTGWVIFAGAILAVAAWEWAGLAGLSAAGRLSYSAALAAFSIWIAWPWTHGPSLREAAPYAASVLFWTIIVPFWLSRSLQGGSILFLAAAGWVVLAPCYFALVQLRALNPTTLLFYMGVVWIADTAAYFTGRFFGRRKLAPTLSPGKTWEGAAGALLAVSAYGILWTFWIEHGVPAGLRAMPAWPLSLLVFLWVLTVLSICGDLFESGLKRRVGVKDSGSILPGHGGMLDRIDALVPVLPLAALVFVL
jgi:phosphatidate cytidylyltransferase